MLKNNYDKISHVFVFFIIHIAYSYCLRWKQHSYVACDAVPAPSLTIFMFLYFVTCLYINSYRRATEMQAKFIEEETQRRIEDVVMKRVEEELAKRKIDVDEEVMRKVEEAKKHVEHHLEGEYERRTKEIAEQFKSKEVIIVLPLLRTFFFFFFLTN